MDDITSKELHQRLSNGEKLNIIDVREEWEFEEKNIGAVLIPLDSLPDRLSEIDNFKEQELIIHCKSGARSGRAKQFLETQGYTKVRNLLGGILGYLEQETQS